MHTKKNIRNGFTLIELLVVMAILAILVVSGVASFTSTQKKSRDTKRKNDLRQISLAMESYYNDMGGYPEADASNGKIKGCISAAGVPEVCNWGATWKNMSVNPSTVYMLAMPADPQSTSSYYYDSDGTYFKVYARLENTKDEGSGVDQTGYAGTNCGGGSTCTYGIASTNIAP